MVREEARHPVKLRYGTGRSRSRDSGSHSRSASASSAHSTDIVVQYGNNVSYTYLYVGSEFFTKKINKNLFLYLNSNIIIIVTQY